MATKYRTQLRLTQVTGSFAPSGVVTLGTHIEDTLGASASGSIAADSLLEVMSHMASSIKRIHGGNDFSGQSAGEFSVAAITPATTDTSALGSTAKQWSDLFLAEGGVINFDNGDVTVTQTGNTLAVDGGRLLVDDTTEATSTTDGSLQTDGGLSVAKSAVIGDDLDLLSDGAIMNIGSTSKFTLTAVDANNAVMASANHRLAFGNAGEYIAGDGTDLSIVSSGLVSVSGDTNVTGTGTFSGILKTDDSTEATTTTDGSLQTDGGLSVVKSAVIGDDLDLLSNSAIFKVGSDQPFTLTHSNANNTLMASSGHRLAFGNAGEYISGDGTDLKIVSSNDIDVTGDLNVTGEVTSTKLTTLASAEGVTTIGSSNAAVFSADGKLAINNTTEATTTTDGSLQTDGGLSVALSAVIGDDLDLLSDSAILNLGAGKDFRIVHNGTTGGTIDADGTIVIGGTAATSVELGRSGQTVTISGNLDVNGTTTTVDSVNMSVQDSIIALGVSGSDGGYSTTGDRGILFPRGTDDSAVAGFWWDGTDFNLALSKTGPTSGSFASVDSYSSLKAGAGTFSGRLLTDDATEATSTTDGSLQTDGGLSVVKDVIAGNDVYLLSDSAVLGLGAGKDATFTHDGTTGLTIAASPISIDSTGELHLNSTTGDIKLQDGGVDQIIFDLDSTGGEVIMKPGVDSDDLVFQQYDGTEVIRIEDNGDVDFVGGLGSSGVTITSIGNISTDGRVIVDDTTEATSTTDGSLQTDGGLSVAKSAVIGDDLDLLSNGAILKVGSDQPFTLTHSNANNTLLATTDHRLAFGTVGEYILGDGTDLKIVSSGLVAVTGDTNVTGAGTFSGILKTDDTTDATSKTDGSLQTDGGLSVAKAIYNGTAATLAADSGVVTIGSATAATFSAAGLLNINNTTDSTAATNGSLQTDGGLGVVKDIVAGNDIKLLSDSAVLSFGADSDTTLTHTDGTGLTLNGSNKLCFTDTNEAIYSDGTNLFLASGGQAYSLPNSGVTDGYQLQTNGSGVLSWVDPGSDVTDRQKIVSGSATETVVSGSNLRAFGGLGEFNVNINTLGVTRDQLRESMTLFVNGQLMLSGTVGQVGLGNADYHIISGSSANHVSMILGFDLLEDDTVHAVIR